MINTILDIEQFTQETSQVSEILKEIETSFAFITLTIDKIVRVDFKADIDFDIEEAKLLFKVLQRFYNRDKLLVLINTGEGVMISNDARKFTVSDEVSSIVKADALVVNNLATKLLVKAIEISNQTPRLIKTFNNENDAIGWLKNIK